MNKAFPYIIISAIWILIVLLIDHTGEFPLIDDWAYAHGVKDYLFEGVLKISDWVAMTQVGHLFMGVGWSKLFGYSLENLREMTMLVSFLGSILFYWLTGYFSRSVVLRLIGSLILTVNPIWMYLSHTFMTDVPFTVLFLALVLILIKIVCPKKEYLGQEVQEGQEDQIEHRAQDTEHSKKSAQGSESAGSAVGSGQGSWGSGQVLLAARRSPLFPTSYYLLPLILVLSSILVLIRQTGLGLGFSFLLWVVLMDRDRRRMFLVPAVVLVTAQVLTLVGYEWYMSEVGALSTRYHGASSLGWILDRPWWPVRAAYYVLIQLQYLGMFLLPLLPFVWMAWRRVGARNFSRWAYMAAGVVVLGMGVAVGGDILMNPRYTHLMQYDTVGHVMTIDFTYERLEFSRDLYPLWVILHALGLLNVFLIMVVGSGKWGVVARSSPFTVHSEGIDEGRGTRDERKDKRLAGKQVGGFTVFAHKGQEVQEGQGVDESVGGKGQSAESAESAGGRRQSAESAGGRRQSADERLDTARRSRMGGLLLSGYRFLKAQRAFDHPITWIILILAGYTVFISIGQFVFDRYLMLHLPLMILAVLYLIENQGARSGEQGADKRLAGKQASGQADFAHKDQEDQEVQEPEESAGARNQSAGARDQGAGGRNQSAGARDQGAGARNQSAGARDQGAGGRDQGAASGADGQFTVYRLPFTISLISYPLSLILLILSFLFSTIGVHDSFEWNRVRFGAIKQLEAQGITPHQIDGGAEYNSWQRTGPLQPLRLNEKSWWYVDGDEYAIAHEEIPGYFRISAHPFTRYYGLQTDTLYVIRREQGAASGEQ
jgi:hypothetical protein